VSICWLTSVCAARLRAGKRKASSFTLPTTCIPIRPPIADSFSTTRSRVHQPIGDGPEPGGEEVEDRSRGTQPGSMRTERVLPYTTTEARKKQFRFDLSESPEYIEAQLQLSPPTVIRKPGNSCGYRIWPTSMASPTWVGVIPRVLVRAEPRGLRRNGAERRKRSQGLRAGEGGRPGRPPHGCSHGCERAAAGLPGLKRS